VSPRRRTVDDLTIAEHACHLLLEGGPEAVTFSQLSQRGGLAPPTLVQRLGSREGMLKAAALALRARLPAAFAADRQSSPLANLRGALHDLAPDLVAALRVAAAVPMGHYALELRKQISLSLAAAMEASELPRCDVAQLTRSIQISALGAAAAALLERGDVAAEVVEALDAQLASYI
jgi:AcrR family transcriptional regulator